MGGRGGDPSVGVRRRDGVERVRVSVVRVECAEARGGGRVRGGACGVCGRSGLRGEWSDEGGAEWRFVEYGVRVGCVVVESVENSECVVRVRVCGHVVMVVGVGVGERFQETGVE